MKNPTKKKQKTNSTTIFDQSGVPKKLRGPFLRKDFVELTRMCVIPPPIPKCYKIKISSKDIRLGVLVHRLGTHFGRSCYLIHGSGQICPCVGRGCLTRVGGGTTIRVSRLRSTLLESHWPSSGSHQLRQGSVYRLVPEAPIL